MPGIKLALAKDRPAPDTPDTGVPRGGAWGCYIAFEWFQVHRLSVPRHGRDDKTRRGGSSGAVIVSLQ